MNGSAVLSLTDIARRLKITRPVISLDLETTGKVAGVDRIIQIGLLKVRPTLEVTQWSTFVDPQLPIPAEATLKHKITNDMVAGAPTFGDLSPGLAAGLSDVDFIGYNLRGFDLKFFDAEFKRVGVAWSSATARVLDPLRLWQIVEPRDLTAFVKRFLDESHEDAHDAMADVNGTTRGLRAFLDRFPELPTTLQALHDLSYPRDPSWVDEAGKLVWRSGEACVGFSVHNGKSLRQMVAGCACRPGGRHMKGCTKGYLEWMLTADFPADVKAILQFALAGKFPLQAMSEAA